MLGLFTYSILCVLNLRIISLGGKNESIDDNVPINQEEEEKSGAPLEQRK